MIVGAHAVAAYATPRATGDLDIWVRATPDNADRVWAALVEFGAPLDDLKRDDLATPDVVFQIGLPPARIDILTSIEAVDFARAWPGRTVVDLWGIAVPILGRDELIRNKRALGRERDVADLADLERGREPS